MVGLRAARKGTRRLRKGAPRMGRGAFLGKKPAIVVNASS